jgi:hypothetical protein
VVSFCFQEFKKLKGKNFKPLDCPVMALINLVAAAYACISEVFLEYIILSRIVIVFLFFSWRSGRKPK